MSLSVFQTFFTFRLNRQLFLPAAFSFINYSHVFPCKYSTLKRKNLFTKPVAMLYPNHLILNSVRFKGVKKEKPVDWLPFPWDWPPRYSVFENSGDLIKTNEVDPLVPKPDFELSDELKDADDSVKKVFSAATATIKERAEINKREMLKKIQRHPLDFDSLEVRIALMTVRVRKLFELRALAKKNVRIKVALQIAIQKRNKLLKDLCRSDFQRFSWLVKVLQLEYNPHPMGVVKERFTKKWDLRRLTKEYCKSLKSQKRAAFHEELKAQQEEFLREKEKTLAWIAEEEKIIEKRDCELNA